MATLDVGVTLVLKKNPTSIKDMDFSYADKSTRPNPGIIVDKFGDIELNTGPAPGPPLQVSINFQLNTKEVEFKGKKYFISFELDSTSTSKQLLVQPLTCSGTVFSTPVVHPNKLVVGTQSASRDGCEYKYTLIVGAKDSSGQITEVRHDPKIRNGGNKADDGIAPGHASMAVLVAAALGLLLWSALSARHRAKRNTEVQR